MTELGLLLQKAVAAYNAMTPTQRAEHDRLQRRSWILAEAGFGNDKDEAEYAATLAAGNQEKIAQLKAESDERVKQAKSVLDKMGL